MANRTQQRPRAGTARLGRSAMPTGGGRAGRGTTPAGRFARTSTSAQSPARFGRPTPTRKPNRSSKKSSGSPLGMLGGLVGGLGGSKKKSGSGMSGKGAGGLAALAGLAGLALKNRSKISDKLNSGRRSHESEAIPAHTPQANMTPPAI